MWTEADMSLWRGRIDRDGDAGLRWHQRVQPLPPQGTLEGGDVLLGFACDEGVRRNQGRVGAADGPDHIRSALTNLPRAGKRPLFDGGNVRCVDQDLESAQAELALRVADILGRGGLPIVLGGGHEVAWGSFQGLRDYRPATTGPLGIINFDAHFDLRDPAHGASSGTPFRQIAGRCAEQAQPFHYLVLGINPAANTPALFDYARSLGVQWFEDRDCVAANRARLEQALDDFIAPLVSLYLTVCLDAFPASLAPGVSAPGIPGVCPHTALVLLAEIAAACRRHDTELLMLDIAEMNPHYDRDAVTARWAARLVHEFSARR